MNPPKVIRVTAGHIATGHPGTGDRCPIALAIREQWPTESADIHVDSTGINVWPTDWIRIDATLPATAAAFVLAFDDGYPVAPFEFAVEWIDQDGVGL